MNWQSWSEFWAMGGAGFFVWGSYGLTLLLILVALIHLFQRRKHTLTRLRRWRRATAARPGSASPDSKPSDS